MTRRKCGLCGKDPAAGFASVNDVFFCHGDDDETPTCYMRASAVQANVAQRYEDMFSIRVERADEGGADQ